MAQQPVDHRGDGTLLDFGEDVRVERCWLPDQQPVLDHQGRQKMRMVIGHNDKPILGKDGQPQMEPATVDVLENGQPKFTWVVYQRVHTGAKHAPDGTVLKAGKHPVIKHEETGHPVDTHETHVWVPVVRASRAQAMAKAQQLAK